MINIERLDKYIPATYKGVPKVCFHCRLAGHKKKDRLELQNIQCYRCKGYGHFRRHCKAEGELQKTVSPKEKSFEEELDNYMNLTKASGDDFEPQQKEKEVSHEEDTAKGVEQTTASMDVDGLFADQEEEHNNENTIRDMEESNI